MKIVELPITSKKEALECLDGLRKAIESGEVCMFVAVGVADNDETLLYQATTKNVTRLRLIGAAANLWHHIMHDE